MRLAKEAVLAKKVAEDKAKSDGLKVEQEEEQEHTDTKRIRTERNEKFKEPKSAKKPGNLQTF